MSKTISTREEWKAKLAEIREFEASVKADIGKAITALAPDAEIYAETKIIYETLTALRLADIIDDAEFLNQIAGNVYERSYVKLSVKLTPDSALNFLIFMESGKYQVEIVGGEFVIRERCLSSMDDVRDFVKVTVPKLVRVTEQKTEAPKAPEPDVGIMTPSAEPEVCVRNIARVNLRGQVAIAARFACNLFRYRNDPLVDFEMLADLAAIRDGRDRRYLHAVLRRLSADCSADLVRRLSPDDDFDAACAGTYGAARNGFMALLRHVDRNGMTRPFHRGMAWC